MKANEAERLRDTSKFAEFTGEALDFVPAHDHSALSSVRRDTFLDHEIEITTTYEIKVDGVSVMTHLSVTNDGKLHCHALPNYVFPSAIGLVRQLIKLYPHEFGSRQAGDGHGGHTHEHP